MRNTTTSTSLPQTWQELLRTDIGDAVSWGSRFDGKALVYRPQGIFQYAGIGEDTERVYTVADLHQMDPRLPEVFKVLNFRKSYFLGKDVRATLRLLIGELTLLPPDMLESSYRERPPQYADMATLILQQTPSSENPDRIFARFDGFTVAETDLGVPYVVLCENVPFCVNPAWLDQHRPTWRNMLLMAEGLNLSPRECAKLLLFDSPQTPSAATDLPDMADHLPVQDPSHALGGPGN